MRSLCRTCRGLPLAGLAAALLAACGADGDPGTAPDTEPPMVSVTAPVVDAPVTGFVSITAEASDKNGVAGVQFYIDGVKFGAEDLGAPYLAVWYTGNMPNGPHTLSAVARDVSGNVTTSAVVPVTIANPVPGSIVVTIISTGPVSDPDGYSLHLDDGDGTGVNVNGTVTLAGLTPGPHTVNLSRVWPFCAVSGQRPRAVDVPSGGSIAVTLEVACVEGPGGRIAYSQDLYYGGGSAAIVTPRDGSVGLLIQDGLEPSWSPDGTELVFVRGTALYRIRADGTGETLLTAGVAGAGAPDWGPGTTIAFTGERNAGPGAVYDIYLIESDGSGKRPLFAEAATRLYPALSPDGARVAFTQQLAPGTVGWLAVANLDGSNSQQLTEGFNDFRPDWSPDGSRIAFTRTQVFDFDPRILVLDLDESSMIQVGGPAYGPSWSPDGEWIAFTTVGGQVGIMRADGTSAGVIVDFGSYPEWAR